MRRSSSISASPTGEVLENHDSPLTGISVGDIDSASLTLTLTASSGTLSAASGSGVTIGGSGTGTLTLSGSSADINAFVAAGSVNFLTEEDNEADVVITSSVSDGDLDSEAATTLTVTPDSIDGDGGSNAVVGDGEDNTMRGFGGNDTMYGMGGDDRIEGGAGNDTIYGGEGSDTFVFRAGDGIDTLVDSGPQDRIVVYDYQSYSMVNVDREWRLVFDANNYIVLPNNLHAEYTIRAARAGVHVLCEKPMAVTSAIGTRASAAKPQNMAATPNSPRATCPNGRRVCIAVHTSPRQA